MPHISGSTTVCTNAVAMAASIALPPAARISLPVSVASGCGVTTIPLFVMMFSDIGGRASGGVLKRVTPPGFDSQSWTLDHRRSTTIDIDGCAGDVGAL